MENRRPLQILHIDDSDDDALLLSRVLRQCGHPTDLKWLPSARNAIDFLQQTEAAAFPDLIFCDLRMPGMSGHDFIRWLRASGYTVPVIVFSSSDLMEDIRAAYAAGANSFLTKPLWPGEILKLMQSALEYWRHCHLVTRPPDP